MGEQGQPNHFGGLKPILKLGPFLFFVILKFLFYLFIFCNIDNDFQNYLHKMNTIWKRRKNILAWKPHNLGWFWYCIYTKYWKKNSLKCRDLQLQQKINYAKFMGCTTIQSKWFRDNQLSRGWYLVVSLLAEFEFDLASLLYKNSH